MYLFLATKDIHTKRHYVAAGETLPEDLQTIAAVKQLEQIHGDCTTLVSFRFSPYEPGARYIDKWEEIEHKIPDGLKFKKPRLKNRRRNALRRNLKNT